MQTLKNVAAIVGLVIAIYSIMTLAIFTALYLIDPTQAQNFAALFK